MLPAAAPQIFAGLRTSLSLSLILMVISEMVASANGIGYFILQSQRSFAITEMWSGILLLGLLGYLFNAVFTLVERRVLAWHRGARAGAQLDAQSHPPQQDLRQWRDRPRRRSGTSPSRSTRASSSASSARPGCGKTTLLKTMSGLLEPTSGTVELDGKRVTDPPEQMALVFQDYSRSLYPWMTVAENVEFPLRRRPKARAPDARSSRRSSRSGSTGSPTSTRGSSPAACSSASRSPAASPTGPRSC